MRTAIFSQSIKTEICLSNQQSTGPTGLSCYLCQYSFFRAIGKEATGKSENLHEITFHESFL